MSESRMGRPRDEKAREAVLRAARDLVREHGYEQLTIVQIARSAGVGRQTIYRWWPSKQAIIAECVLEQSILLDLVLAPASGDFSQDLVTWVAQSTAVMEDGESTALFRALLSAAAVDDDAARRLYERFERPLREAIRSALAGSDERTAAATADALIGTLIHAVVSRDPGTRARAVDVAALVAAGARSPAGG